MGHGDADPLVKVEWGRETAKELRELGWGSVDFREYKGLVHSADPKEMDDLEEWLGGRLPPGQASVDSNVVLHSRPLFTIVMFSFETFYGKSHSSCLGIYDSAREKGPAGKE
ncbi:MAG: hypothetical protein Q9179_004734 [Wetmoreana sp. 5 TL-2023]